MKRLCQGLLCEDLGREDVDIGSAHEVKALNWIELNWNTLFDVDNSWKYKISYIAHITMNMSN